MDTESKNYEITYLISSAIKEEDVFSEAGKITGFLQDAKSVVGHIEEPKRRRLAYPIKKLSEAYFGWTRFSTVPENIAGFEKRLKLEPNVIRYLIVEAEEIPVDISRPSRIRRTPLMSKPAKQPAEEKEKMDIGELDKRLEEILGK